MHSGTLHKCMWLFGNMVTNHFLKFGIVLRAQMELLETSVGNRALFAYFQIRKDTLLNNIYPMHFILILKIGGWDGTEESPILPK